MKGKYFIMIKIIQNINDVKQKPLHHLAKDFTTYNFTNCTPLYPVYTEEKPSHWLCQCNCGNFFIAPTYVLSRNGNISCGCQKIKTKDITNQRFGKLVALYPTEQRSSSGSVVWHCKCDCGNEKDIPINRLTSGGAKSCGCVGIEKLIEYNHTRVKDLTNQHFGLLTALKPIATNNNRSIVWLCQCECGNQTQVSSADLLSGNTKSCGCQRNKSYGENKIAQLLTQANINFIREKTFDNLVGQDQKTKLRFDFYLPDYNIIIEYDGQQHSIVGTGVFDNEQKFEKTQYYDTLKNQWCKDNNIKLIRIPYTHYDQIQIEDLLSIYKENNK